MCPSAEFWRRDIPHPLIFVRFAFFVFLAFLNFQVLVFSAWNIAANASSQIPGAPIFYLLSVAMVFFFIPVALVEFLHPNTKTGHVKFEVVWTGTIAVFQMGITITLTADGPVAACRQDAAWNVCASSSLLLPLAWAACLSLLSYFFALTILAILHMQAYPNVWSLTVYTVPWFHQIGCSDTPCYKFYQEALQRPLRRKAEDPWVSWVNGDLESDLPVTKEYADPPVWAKNLKVRRGQDHPFGGKQDSKSNSSPSVSSKRDSLPALPDEAYLKDSRYSLDLGSQRAEIPTQRCLPVASFPPSVENENVPIPLPRLSLWLPADAPHVTTKSLRDVRRA